MQLDDYLDIIEYIPDAVVVANREGTIVLINPRTEELFGYSRGEILGKPVEILVPDRFREKHIKQFKNYFTEPKARHIIAGINIVGRHKDGSEVPLEITLSSWNNGDETLVISAIRDVTERKRVEEELKWKNKNIRILNTVTQAVHRSHSLEEIYNIALDMATGLDNVDMASIYLVDKDGKEAVLQAHRNFPKEFVQRARRIPCPKGGTWKVITTGKTINIKNIQTDPDIGPAGKDLGHHGALGIPIASEKEVIGVIWFSSCKEREFEEEEVALLTSIGDQIATAIARAKLYRDLERKSRYEEIIRTVTQDVHSSIDLQEVLDNAVESMSKNIEATGNTAIYMVEGDEAVLKAHRGLTDSFVDSAGRIPHPKSFTWKTIMEGEARYCADTDGDEYIGLAGRKEGIKSYLSMPITYEGNTVGCININSKQKNALDEEELKLLEIVSNQISISIKNAQLAEQILDSKEALRIEKEHYRHLVETTNVVLWEADVETRQFTYVGPQAEQLLGYPVEKWYEQDFWPSHLHPDDRDAALETCAKLAATEKEYEFDYRMIASDGSIHWLHDVVTVTYVNDRPETLRGFLVDISERKKVEEALKRSEERYRTLYDQLPLGVCLIDRDLKITHCNEGMVRIFQSSSDKIIGLDLHTLKDQTFVPLIADAFKGIVGTLESPYKTTTSSTDVWLSVKVVPLYDEENHVHSVMGVVEDVTKRKLDEATLSESASRHRTIVEQTYDMIIEVDALGTILYANPQCQDIMGYDTEELVGTSFLGLVHEEERSVAIADFQKGLQSVGTHRANICRCRHKNGDFKWIESIGKAFRTSAGHLHGLIAARDVTERIEGEEALRESEERYRALVENSYDLIIETDVYCRYLYVSPNHGSVLGYKPEDLVGKNIFENIHPDDIQMVMDKFIASSRHMAEALGLSVSDIMSGNLLKVINPQDLPRVIATLETAIEKLRASVGASAVYRFKHHDGGWRWLESAGRPFLTPEGEIKIVVSSRDITERKRAEEELLKTQESLSEAQRIAHLGNWDWNIRTNELFWSDEIYRIFGLAPEEFGATYEAFLSYVHPDDREFVKKSVNQALYKGKNYSIDHRIVLPDGSERIVHEQAEVRFDDGGRPVHMVGTVHDITERKRMEEDLRNVQKLESVGVMAGGIAHDFNNLLTGIMSNVSFARLHTDTKIPLYKRLQEAENACLRATHLTNQLLTFSRGGEPIKGLTSLAKLIRESADFSTLGSNVKCEYSIPSDLWSAEVDKGQISQVINNLVINAKQAMLGGGIVRLSAENVTLGKEHDILEDGHYVKITVNDSGTGIPGEHLQKIFDPYFSTKKKGSGLGLAISYSIISKHAGSITADSEVGVGTTFTIYIPATGKHIAEKEERVEDDVEGGEGRILVMDDEEMIRAVVATILEAIGYEVRHARDGTEVLKLYGEALEEGDPFDAVLLDLTVPGGMGGKETVEELIRMDPNVKAIVSSGYSNEPIMADFENYGFKGIVTKPYSTEAIIQVLRRVVGH